MGDKVAGGTIYWLSDTVDAGDMAAQDYCFIEPYEVAEDLWRDKLFPMGVRLFARVLRDISEGHIVAVPQEESIATWEPSWERPPLRRPDLTLIGPSTLDNFNLHREESALHGG